MSRKKRHGGVNNNTDESAKCLRFVVRIVPATARQMSSHIADQQIYLRKTSTSYKLTNQPFLNTFNNCTVNVVVGNNYLRRILSGPTIQPIVL